MASCLDTGEKSIMQHIDWTSSRHFLYTSDGGPPPHCTHEVTMHMQSTAKGECSWRASKVSMWESKTGRKVLQPW
jgi:hypothetical protein